MTFGNPTGPTLNFVGILFLERKMSSSLLVLPGKRHRDFQGSFFTRIFVVTTLLALISSFTPCLYASEDTTSQLAKAQKICSYRNANRW